MFENISYKFKNRNSKKNLKEKLKKLEETIHELRKETLGNNSMGWFTFGTYSVGGNSHKQESDDSLPTTEERDLNVKETPSTAKSKRGRPKEITRVVTKSSQSGLREGLTRATFIIREDTLDKLKERAYTDRKKLKDLVTEALDYYLEHNKSEETK